MMLLLPSIIIASAQALGEFSPDCDHVIMGVEGSHQLSATEFMTRCSKNMIPSTDEICAHIANKMEDLDTFPSSYFSRCPVAYAFLAAYMTANSPLANPTECTMSLVSLIVETQEWTKGRRLEEMQSAGERDVLMIARDVADHRKWLCGALRVHDH